MSNYQTTSDTVSQKLTSLKKTHVSSFYYSSTSASSYLTWNADVDLGPAAAATDDDDTVPPEDKFIHVSYNALQRTLFEIGFPETEVRGVRRIDKNAGKDQVTIAVLSSRADCTSLLLEGKHSAVFSRNLDVKLEPRFNE
jgi:hypothetical protein